MISRILPLFMVLLNTLPLFSQDQKAFRQMYKEAESILLYLDQEDDALKLFLAMEKMEPSNANIQYKIGLCYINMKGKKNLSIPYFRNATLHMSETYEDSYEETNAPFDALFYLGMAYHINNEFDEAIEAYQKFIEQADVSSFYQIEYVKEQINGCILARDLYRDPIPVRIEKLDLQTPGSRRVLFPACSGDGNSMALSQEDEIGYRILMLQKTDRGWSKPNDITDELQTDGDGIATFLSANGKSMIIYREDRGLGDLYLSTLQDNRWTPIEKLNKNINTKYWEASGCLSPDGQILYFSSNRKGGYGRLDIYRSVRSSGGDWGPAENLGPVLNSPLDDDTPYLSNDGRTLFFSSQGHNSMGGFDHFYSRSAEGKQWSIPVNFGYPVSTSDDDIFLSPADSELSFYCTLPSQQDPSTSEVCLLSLMEEKPRQRTVAPVNITLRGIVKLQDADEHKMSTARVEVVNPSAADTLAKVAPDSKTGAYAVELPKGQYEVVIEARGYEPQVHTLAVAETNVHSEVTLNSRLVTEEVADSIYWITENIYFDFNRYDLNREALLTLEKLSSIMQEFPTTKFELVGHTDTVGTKIYNLKLSSQRATATAQYLFGKGIQHERLITKGVGEILAVKKSKLENLQENPDDQRYNRRVEIRILRPEHASDLPEEITVPSYLRKKFDLTYTILILKVKDKLPPDYFDKYAMDELRYVREQTVSDGYIYTLGTFAEKPRAVSLLGKLQKAGFTESRLLDQHEMSDLVIGAEPDPGFFAMPEKITEIPWYTIQVLARKSIPKPGSMNLTELMVFKGKDGLYRFCTGKYQGYINAMEALPGVRERWFRDAFIQELKRLEQGLPDGPDLRK